VDVAGLTAGEARRILDTMGEAGVGISGLGYYPNALAADAREARVAIDHIKRVIRAAAKLGVGRMNTFIGRDPSKSVDANWPRFLKVWKPIVRFAADQGVRVGIENCPMLFSSDEWPGGKNLGTTPAIWRRMFSDIPAANFGLNYDPSHLVWQRMDPVRPLVEFARRIFHVHAKDVRVDADRLNDVGIMATPLQFHTPKLPGLGEVNWGRFISVLGDAGYMGPVCVEVEDRSYEGSLARRKAALRQSATYLRQFIPAAK
jgi:sugar phosphate isomerase/epimerase